MNTRKYALYGMVFCGVLAVVTFSWPFPRLKAAETGRELIGKVGFPVAPVSQEQAKLGGEHLQVVTDRCLDLKSISLQDNQLVVVLAATDKWPIQAPNMLAFPSLCIRYFDKDGQYLGHFITKEGFIAEWGSEFFPEYLRDILKAQQVEVIELPEKGMPLKYTINARDADYIAIVEVSFDGVPDMVVPSDGGRFIDNKEHFIEYNREYSK